MLWLLTLPLLIALSLWWALKSGKLKHTPVQAWWDEYFSLSIPEEDSADEPQVWHGRARASRSEPDAAVLPDVMPEQPALSPAPARQAPPPPPPEPAPAAVVAEPEPEPAVAPDIPLVELPLLVPRYARQSAPPVPSDVLPVIGLDEVQHNLLHDVERRQKLAASERRQRRLQQQAAPVLPVIDPNEVRASLQQLHGKRTPPPVPPKPTVVLQPTPVMRKPPPSVDQEQARQRTAQALFGAGSRFGGPAPTTAAPATAAPLADAGVAAAQTLAAAPVVEAGIAAAQTLAAVPVVEAGIAAAQTLAAAPVVEAGIAAAQTLAAVPVVEAGIAAAQTLAAVPVVEAGIAAAQTLAAVPVADTGIAAARTLAAAPVADTGIAAAQTLAAAPVVDAGVTVAQTLAAAPVVDAGVAAAQTLAAVPVVDAGVTVAQTLAAVPFADAGVAATQTLAAAPVVDAGIAAAQTLAAVPDPVMEQATPWRVPGDPAIVWSLAGDAGADWQQLEVDDETAAALVSSPDFVWCSLAEAEAEAEREAQAEAGQGAPEVLAWPTDVADEAFEQAEQAVPPEVDAALSAAFSVPPARVEADLPWQDTAPATAATADIVWHLLEPSADADADEDDGEESGDDVVADGDSGDDDFSAPEPVYSGFAAVPAAVVAAPKVHALPVVYGDACLPALSLLRPPETGQAVQSEELLLERGILIEEKCAEFKVRVAVVDAYAGPVITRYEVEPAIGVRGSQVVNLAKDLSRALGVASIRVVETIPGKTCMGLELPNPQRQMIRLSEILGADVFLHAASKLTLALGHDISGAPVVMDLARAPHLLVAGTTGSGKSVGVNAMILSMLYKATPDEVRFIMIDPKMLELSVYNDIPHLLAPVVTDMKLAANALNWCVGEMEKRYRLMSHFGVRNLAGFNDKVRAAEAAGSRLRNPFSLTPETPEPLETLPFIVVVVDEFADLMMVAGKKIEELIARLAQKARAAGIHLILATQRPSVDVITGLIKANIPTRIAFQVSSKIDSRTILDQMGAESLLGQGDMLYLPPGSGYPQRVHGAFVTDEEVHAIVESLKQWGEPNYVEGLLTGESVADDESGEARGRAAAATETDPLYDEAVEIVLRTRKASISSVQRQLRIGYNRAARLIEDMEAAGIVSSMENNGNRTVLVPQREF